MELRMSLCHQLKWLRRVVFDPWPSSPAACLPSVREMTRVVTGSPGRSGPPPGTDKPQSVSFGVLCTQAAVQSLCERQIPLKPKPGLLPWKRAGRGGFSLNTPLCVTPAPKPLCVFLVPFRSCVGFSAAA